MSKISSFVFSLIILGTSSACFYGAPNDRDPEDEGEGDLSFDWSFEGERDCFAANVESIAVLLEDSQGEVINDVFDCREGGLTISDLDAGNYTLTLDAISGNTVSYQAPSRRVTIRGERDNNIGLVEFEATGQSNGSSVAGIWVFRFPTDDSSVRDCVTAGVDIVYVELTALGEQDPIFAQDFDCNENGFIIEGLPADTYEIAMLALGTYENEEIELYTQIVEDIDLGANSVLDLGDIGIDRIDENFGDMNVTISLPGTCASLNNPELEFTIFRLDDNVEEEKVTFPCNTESFSRVTFLPGDYRIDARGIDSTLSGSNTFSIEPNGETQLTVTLN